jgi:hypothetical protein
MNRLHEIEPHGITEEHAEVKHRMMNPQLRNDRTGLVED